MFNFDPNNFQLEDLDRIVDQSQEAMRSIERIQESLGEIVGVGAAADGMVEARVTGTGGIREITINPRALRLESHRLAEAATEAVRLAQGDAERQTAELMGAALGGEPVLDRERLREQFRDVREGFSHRMDQREETAQRRAWDR